MEILGMKVKSDFDFVTYKQDSVWDRTGCFLKKKKTLKQAKDSNICIGYQDYY